MRRTSRLLLMANLLTVIATGPGRAAAQAPRDGPMPAFQPFRTVWAGVYTKAEAQRGKDAYADLCARCHGPELKGGASAPALAGAAFFDRWHDLRLGDVVLYIQAAMPRAHEFFVPPDKTRDIVALILDRSGIPAGRAPIPDDAKALGEILITRRPPAAR